MVLDTAPYFQGFASKDTKIIVIAPFESQQTHSEYENTIHSRFQNIAILPSLIPNLPGGLPETSDPDFHFAFNDTAISTNDTNFRSLDIDMNIAISDSFDSFRSAISNDVKIDYDSCILVALDTLTQLGIFEGDWVC